MSISEIVNIVLAGLSFILATISVITIVITLKQNQKMIKATELQLNEMRKEHQFSQQPILTIVSEDFLINRPRLYYTPPEDQYKFLSAYDYNFSVSNVSTAAAINIDIAASLITRQGERELKLDTTAERWTVLPAGADSRLLHIRFSGDSVAFLYDALREQKASYLPKINIRITYKNTSGGHFYCEKTSILALPDEELDSLRTWHMFIKGVPTAAKELIARMKSMPKDEKWENLFNKCKDSLDTELGDTAIKALTVECKELPEKYDFKCISREEYEEYKSQYSYPHLVYKEAECCSPTQKIEI